MTGDRSRCRSCGVEIVWAVSWPPAAGGTGRPMPIDPEPVDGGNLRLTNQYGRTWVQVVNPGDGTHQPHWTTCPQALEWRHRHAGHGPETEGQR